MIFMMKFQILLLLPLLLTLANGQMYDRLYNKLMTRYESVKSRDTLPADSLTDVVHVNVTLMLIELSSLDAKTGEASIEAWMGYTWRDRRLTWNAAQNNGIEKLHIPQKFIWRPDIALFNGHVKTSGDLLAVVDNHGAVMMYPPTTIKTRCNLADIKTNNTVVCNLKFGSWTYDGSKISPRLTGTGVDLSAYRLSVDWEIVNTEAHRNVNTYTCCPEPYLDVTFKLYFRQRNSGWW